MILRPYQQRMDDARRASTARSRCNQAPTGSGKSVLIRKTADDAPSMVAMVHREYLVDQLHELIPEAQVIKAGQRWDRRSRKIIGMVQTLCRRDPEDLPRPDCGIVDEAHHCSAASYQTVLSYWPGMALDGYTATPIRTDGRGLDDSFDELIAGPQYDELIEAGYLKPFEMYSIPSGIDLRKCKVVAGDYSRSSQNEVIRKSKVFGDVEEYWRRYGRDGAHVSFWPSIEAAEHAAGKVLGWEVIHSKLSKDVVRDRIRALEAGSILSLTTVDLVGEGLNIPGICSVSRCRGTKSLGLYMQQSGRCNRGGDGIARVISHVNDWRENEHGFPDDHRQWSLQGRVKRKAEAGMMPVWDCPECWAVMRSQQGACWRCGFVKPREIVIMEERAAELELIKRLKISDIHDHCRTGEDYVAFAKMKGKKPGFAVMRWLDRKRDAVMRDDPFADYAAAGRPTVTQFLDAARECGVNPTYAENIATTMRLDDDRVVRSRRFAG